MNKEYIKIVLAFIIISLGTFIYIGFDLGTASRTVPVTEKFTEKTDYYEITFDSVVSRTIGSDEVNLFIGDLVNNFINLADRDVPDLREQGFQHKYTLDISLETYKTENYLSYVVYIAEYTGGANVNQRVESLVFNIDNKERIYVTDIVPTESHNHFVESLKENLLLSSSGIGVFPQSVNNITIDKIHAFYLTESDIVVLFSKYEVAPGVAGIVTASISR